MPYSLKGNSVIRSDTGAVVKTHPSRERALAHLRALKANVEEGSPAVLGALLEGFDSGKHPRGFHGRWVKGDKVHVVTPQGHVLNGVVDKPAESYDAITSRGTERSTTVTVKWHDGDVTHERPQDVQAGHRPVSNKPLPVHVLDVSAARARRAASGAEMKRKHARATEIATGKRNPVGSQQRRSTPSVTHGSLTRQLENLPAGRYHHLPGLGNGGSLARKTPAGIEVYRAQQVNPEKVHKTPSAAAGHMMRIRNEGVQRAPKVRESASGVLGALLEGR